MLVSIKCYKTLNTHNQSLKAEWELERVFTFAICRSFFASWRCVIFSLRVCCLVWCVLLSIAFLSFLFINNRLADLFIKESITVFKTQTKSTSHLKDSPFLATFLSLLLLPSQTPLQQLWIIKYLHTTVHKILINILSLSKVMKKKEKHMNCTFSPAALLKDALHKCFVAISCPPNHHNT